MAREVYRGYHLVAQSGPDEDDNLRFRYRIVKFGKRLTEITSPMIYRSAEEATEAGRVKCDEIIAKRERDHEQQDHA